ncbi:MAG TPA: SRPBCC domain-containing protein [Gaiellaceae bacterium]|nr:SRPBCC domain-containing protein [Gaiellaceae bacterium]
MSDAANTYRVWIKAEAGAIWEALTDPGQLARYGYGGKFEFDLKPGGAYRVGATDQMLEGGAPEMMVEGEVLEVDAPRRFVQTWHALFDEQLAAESPTRLTYELEPGKGVTLLRVTHDVTGAPLAAGITSGDVAEAGGGFPWVLSDLKTMVESGEPMPTQMGG